MGLAIEAGKLAALRGEVPVGALFVQGDRILAVGRNRREETHRTTAHAEIEALETYNQTFQTWRLPPETALFVTVEPCLMCLGALTWARCEKIYFGCYDPRGEGLRGMQSALKNFTTVEGGIRMEECSALMKDFFAKKRAAVRERKTIESARLE